VNIADALKRCTVELTDHDVPNARQDAVQLVSFVTGRDRTYLVAHPEAELAAEQVSNLAALTTRRAAREPLQYIIGRQEFYRLAFEVTPDVLIPRPETEILVERAIDFLSNQILPRFCEIGVGSGCISVSILYEVKNATTIACDISENALDIARRNAELNGVADRLQLIVSDVFGSIPPHEFDAIISNPPYVPQVDLAKLQPEVREHEPNIALTSGIDGLDLIRRLVDTSPRYLKRGGLLILEMGFDQSGKVRELMSDTTWADIEFLPDLQGIPRILTAVKR
jgi:release factor glutamine methyltransferase